MRSLRQAAGRIAETGRLRSNIPVTLGHAPDRSVTGQIARIYRLHDRAIHQYLYIAQVVLGDCSTQGKRCRQGLSRRRCGYGNHRSQRVYGVGNILDNGVVNITRFVLNPNIQPIHALCRISSGQVDGPAQIQQRVGSQILPQPLH